MRRFRRLRSSQTIRSLVQETHLQKSNFIYPIFVIEGEQIKNPVESMPGIYQYSLDRMGEELDRIKEANISGILIFGIPSHKDPEGSMAYDPNGITQRAIRLIKKQMPELLVVADVCLCEYTSHGHCGLLKEKTGVGGSHVIIDNDTTLPLLCRMSLSLVEAGADMIAPSDMMDGRVAAIRDALDDSGYTEIPIMAYSAKFASGYYAPFRDAAHSAPSFGDRKTYQMDYANGKEAIAEVMEDIREGADLVMVKPALAYLDIIRQVADLTEVPVVAYHVSGEYAMVKAAAIHGWIDEKKIVLENMTAIKRAGASIIITYHALDVARWLEEEGVQ